MNNVQLSLVDFYSNLDLLDDEDKIVKFIKKNAMYLVPKDRLEVYQKYKNYFKRSLKVKSGSIFSQNNYEILLTNFRQTKRVKNIDDFKITIYFNDKEWSSNEWNKNKDISFRKFLKNIIVYEEDTEYTEERWRTAFIWNTLNRNYTRNVLRLPKQTRP